MTLVSKKTHLQIHLETFDIDVDAEAKLGQPGQGHMFILQSFPLL